MGCGVIIRILILRGTTRSCEGREERLGFDPCSEFYIRGPVRAWRNFRVWGAHDNIDVRERHAVL